MQTAVGSASPGDEVIVSPGPYYEGDNTVNATVANLVVHGDIDLPKPRIVSSADVGLQASGSNVTYRDLVVQHTPASGGNAIFLGNGATGERLEVTTTGTYACSIFNGSLLRDSVCSNTNGGVALASASSASGVALANNVTAIATGATSIGADVGAGAGATVTLDMLTVIARGEYTDVRATADAGGTATAIFNSSNYATTFIGPGTGSTNITTPGSGTNQMDAPLFANAAAGNYRQAPGSPTINAGVADNSTGSLDFEGDQRIQGSAIDIGADEADGFPPDTTIDSGPAGTTDDPTPSFTYSAFEALDFTCTLDGAPVACFPSGYTTPTLANGAHTLSVAAGDVFGNVDPTPATRSFTVAVSAPPPPPGGDTTAPQTRIDRGPKSKSSKSKARFVFSADEAGVSFECMLDRKAYKLCTSPRKYKRLKQGKHSLAVRATDAAGNVDASPGTYRWKVKRA